MKRLSTTQQLKILDIVNRVTEKNPTIDRDALLEEVDLQLDSCFLGIKNSLEDIEIEQNKEVLKKRWKKSEDSWLSDLII